MLQPPVAISGAGALSSAVGGGGTAPARGAPRVRGEVPKLLPPSPARRPNVAIISGYPWFYTDQQVTSDLARFGKPTTVRAYEDAWNGVSRGIFLVEFASPAQLAEMKEKLFMCGSYLLAVELMHMTSSEWDRRVGRLPDLPCDLAQLPDTAEGFGRQGFRTRAVCLGLANTVTEEGDAEVKRIRKRLRDGAPKHQVSLPM